MKRLFGLFLAACFVLGSFSQAHAVEIKAKGQMDFAFGFTDNNSMRKDDDERDHFFARQRLRVALEFIVSENLKGVLQMDYGAMNWGREGAALDANERSGTIRRAYLDWTIPNTALNLKVGVQELALPSFTYGNPVFHAQTASVIGSVQVNDNVSLTGFWARPLHDDSVTTKNNEMDLFGVVAMLDYDTFRIAPWLVYGNVGNSSGFWEYRYETGQAGAAFNPTAGDDFSSLIVGGVAFEFFPVDKLGVHMDAMYGHLDSNSAFALNPGKDLKVSGWMVSLLVDYKLDFATPGLIGWYASGDDEDDALDGKFGRLPVATGFSDGFYPTRLAFPGTQSIGDDTKISMTGVGTWGLGVQLADLSFVENLSHTARIVYVQGTNDKDLRGLGSVLGALGEQLYLTTKDSFVEFGFDTTYNIADNLAAYIEIGYLMVDFDRATVGGKDEDMFNAQITLTYSF